MTVNASITITREIDGEEIEMKIDVTGVIEYVGSADWRERGLDIAAYDWDAPPGIELTADEQQRALEALQENI